MSKPKAWTNINGRNADHSQWKSLLSRFESPCGRKGAWKEQVVIIEHYYSKPDSPLYSSKNNKYFCLFVNHLALKLTKKSTSTEENLNLISISKFWLVHWTLKTMCTRFNSHSHCFSQATSAHSKGARGRGGNNRQQYLSLKMTVMCCYYFHVYHYWPFSH